MSVLGMDIGNDNSVVATINKGAIVIVRNDLSERLTPTLVGFSEKERLIGDAGLSKLRSNFNNTCRNIKNLIGKIADVDNDDIELHESYGNLLPCEYNYLGYEVEYKNEKVVFSAVRVLACLLDHLIKTAEKYIGKECKEIVISYPPMYTNCQKECLLAATKIVNVNALRIISDNTAVALDYGMYRMKEFKENEGTLLAFVNIGYANTCICIAKFFSGRCEILCDIGDSNLGGRNLDNELIKYITNLFVNANKFNPLYTKRTEELCEMGNGMLPKFIFTNNEENLINNKTRIKLQDVAIKTKKVLSANNEASIHVECLYEDLDCQGNIDRTGFENLCSPFFLQKLKTLLDKAMEISKVDIKNIHAIEVLGGTTRIPFIQKFLQDYFHLPLSKTLIADESIARGCVLSAAMISKHYKVKDYECIEKIMHPIYVEWYNTNNPNAIKREILYTKDNLKKKQKKITLNEKGEIKMTAFYENSPNLPPNCIKELCSCIVKINEKNDKIIESRILTNFTEYDTFAFIGAENVTRTVVKGKDEHSKNKQENTSLNVSESTNLTNECEENNETEKKSGTDNENVDNVNNDEKIGTEQNNKENEKKNDKKKKKEESANDLKNADLKKTEGKVVTTYSSIPIEILLAPGSYTKKDIINFNEAELNMQHNDTMEGERLKKRNELETMIYETRNVLNGAYKDYAMDEYREKGLVLLDEIEYWLYDNSEENKNAFIKKKEEINEYIKDIVYRYNVHNMKLQNVEKIINHLKGIINTCVEKGKTSESDHIIQKANDLISYIDTMQEKEKDRKLYEDPLYTLNDIEEKFNEVNQLTKDYISKIEEAEKKKLEKEKKEKEKEKEKEKDNKDDKEKENKDENVEQPNETNEDEFNEKNQNVADETTNN